MPISRCSLGVGDPIPDFPVAPFELSFGLADRSYLSSGRKFGIVIQEGGIDKSWSAPRTRSSSLDLCPVAIGGGRRRLLD